MGDVEFYMEIKEITNKETWENFLLQCGEKTFLDSWNWGEFQKAMGHKIWRLGIYDNEQRTMNNEQLEAVALVIKIQAKRGTFLFVPHGPIVKLKVKSMPRTETKFLVRGQKSKVSRVLLKELKKLAKRENAGFIRIAPIWERTEENKNIFQKLGFRQAPTHIHPELTWQLDITESEQKLLMEMRKTTRYLIRKGLGNKDIRIEKSKEIEDVERFNNLYLETVKRHHFAPFSLDYLKKEFRAFAKDDQIMIFLGYYKDKLIASAMVIFWQDAGFYHQGASIASDFPASYVLQWEAIREAKARCCKVYNFWGIAEEGLKNKKHPWWGLTLFKKGFGGKRKEYVKTQDFILSSKYWLNFAVEKMRKRKREL